MRLADKVSMSAAFDSADFFLVDGTLHVAVIEDYGFGEEDPERKVPCGLPVPESFYDLKSATKEDCTWDVCPTCHFAFVPTLFRVAR